MRRDMACAGVAGMHGANVYELALVPRFSEGRRTERLTDRLGMRLVCQLGSAPRYCNERVFEEVRRR